MKKETIISILQDLKEEYKQNNFIEITHMLLDAIVEELKNEK